VKLSGLLGFARAAGKLAVGRMACERVVRRGKAKVLVIAGDASPSTVTDLENLGAAYGVKAYQLTESMDELGQMVGKPPLAVVCITDRHFAAEFEKLMTFGAENG